MSGKLIIIHGLPGSGKSTFSRDYIQSHPKEKVVIVNRDDIRTQLFGAEYHKQNPDPKSENEVTKVENTIFTKALQSGATVLDDNTNLNPRFLKEKVQKAKDLGADIEQEYIEVSVDEAKRRNRSRRDAGGRFVPENVIEKMAAKSYDDTGRMKEFILGQTGVYVVPRDTPGKALIDNFNKNAEKENPIKGKAVVLVDVDGTLAHNAKDADKAFGDSKRNYDYFFRAIEHAPVNNAVRNLANNMRDRDGLNIVVLTGREDGYAKELISFIERSGLKVSRVIAKRKGDMRKDFEFKKEQLDLLKEEGLIPVHSIDDREQSVNFYQDEGLMVSRVKEHHPVAPHKATKDYAEPTIDTVYGSGVCIRCGSKLKDPNKSIGDRCKTKI